MKKEKQFFINGRENEVLLKNWETSDGCIATDRITVDSLPVGYMYREKQKKTVHLKDMIVGGGLQQVMRVTNICKRPKIVESIN